MKKLTYCSKKSKIYINIYFGGDKMVNKQRLIDEFLELVQIDSPSSKEGKVAQVLVKKLEEIGCEVIIDNAGEKTGGETE